MPRPPEGVYKCEEFTFDSATGEVSRNGIVTRLEPQPARVLAVLLERRGGIVSRTELRQVVWSEDTFVDFDRGLNYCVARIRSALGDSAAAARFIETLPRRGYRFRAAPAGQATSTVETPSAKTSPPMAPTARRTRRPFRVGAVLSLVAVVMVGHVVAAGAIGYRCPRNLVPHHFLTSSSPRFERRRLVSTVGTSQKGDADAHLLAGVGNDDGVRVHSAGDDRWRGIISGARH